MRFIMTGTLVAILILTTAIVVKANNQVIIEYFYLPLDCRDCPIGRFYYFEADQIMLSITQQYSGQIKSGQINIEWVDISSLEGYRRWQNYNLTVFPSVVINHEYMFSGSEISEEKVSRVIDLYAKSGVSDEGLIKQQVNVPLAFSMGLLSGLSPCLISLLSFLITYMTSINMKLRSLVLRILFFGAGLVAAYMLMGFFIMSLAVSIPPSDAKIISWIVSGVTIFIGLHLIGIIKLPSKTNGVIPWLSSRLSLSFGGLFLLGFLFSFVKVPCATPFVMIIMTDALLNGGSQGILSLTLFSLGMLIPLIIIGIFSGGAFGVKIRISKGYQRKFRIISGLILLGFGIWLLF